MEYAAVQRALPGHKPNALRREIGIAYFGRGTALLECPYTGSFERNFLSESTLQREAAQSVCASFSPGFAAIFLGNVHDFAPFEDVNRCPRLEPDF